MHASTRCAEDGRDQSFGIPWAFARPWGAKARLVRLGNDRAGRAALLPDSPADLFSPLLHTTGTIGPGERSIVVVFTTYPKGTTWPQVAAAITRLCWDLSLLVPDSRPNFPAD